MAGFSADIGTDAPAAPPPGEFEKGLRSSGTSFGGELTALGGRAVESIGQDDLAHGLYARSAALQRQAATEGPRITSPDQVHSATDALDYGAGLMGQAALPIGLGLAGGLAGRGTVGRILGATVATAPSTIGGQVEAQEADPVQAAAPLGERNVTAAGVGGAQAAITNIVPQVLGGKIVGGALERTAGKGIGTVIAKNLAEGVGGNAAAGVGSEELSQAGATHLDPGRDTSGDAAALRSAGIGAAVPGVVFAGAGAAGEAFHGRGGSPRVAPGAEPGVAGTTGTPPAGAAPAPAKSTDILQTVRDAIAGKGKPADDASQAATIAQGGDLVDDAKLASAPPDAQPGIIKQASDATFAKVQQWAGQLADKADLTPDQRAQLDAATANLSDRGNQAIVAGLKVASDGVEKAKDIGARLSKAFGSDEPTAAQSTADAGPQRAIAQALIAATGDENAVHYAPGVAAAVDHAQVNGAFGGRDLKLLTDTLGDDARTALTAVHDAVGKTDPKSADKFYSAMQQLDEHVFKGVSLRDAVTSSLDPDVAEGMTPEHVQQLVDGIKGYVSDAGTSRLGAAEATLRRTDIRRELQKAFGDKTDDVIARFAEDQHSEGVATKADVADEHGQADELGPDAFENRYFGGGKNAKEPQFMERPDVHRAKFGNESQAERVLKAAQAANPDRAVDYISARDYAKANEVDDAKLAKATDGRPDDHVLVEARGMKQEGKLSKEDVDAVRLDTDKYPESKSRIDTGKQGETYDAVKLVEQMKKTLPYTTGDDSSGMARTKRAFQEGVAALSDHVGKNVKFDDSTVVDRRGTTVGDLRKVTTDTASRGNSRERFEEMNDSELRRASNQLEVRLEKEAERRIAELKDSGARLSKADVGNVYADLKKTEVGKAHDAVSQEIAKREMGKQKETDDAIAGRTDNNPDVEIHTAAASTTPEDLVRKENKPSNAGSVLKKDNTISKLGREQLSSKASELSAGRTAISRALGAKLRGLEGRLDDMTPTEQQRLLRVSTPGGDIVKAADTINELAKKYPAGEARSDIVSASNTKPDEVIARVAKSNDYGQIKESLGKLLDAKRSDSIDRVVDAMNDRLDTIMKDNPDAQYNYLREQMDRTQSAVKGDTSVDLTPEQRAKVEDIIKARLGDTVRTEFAKMLHGGEFEAADKKSMPNAKDIIRVSVHSLDPEGIAYHESMHAFMQALRASGDHNINRVLFTAADTHVVRAQLREMLKDSPEALKQIETSAEERAAYMYQLYEKGALKLGPKTEGVLGKIRDFLKQVLGIWSNDERALHIMKFFSEGEYAKNIGDRSALEAAFKVGTNKNVEAFKEFTKPLRSLASSVLSVGESRLRDTQVPALVKIADLVHTSVGREGAGGDTGYINAARETYTRNVNDLSKRLAPFNVDHLNDALESLQSGKAATSPEGTRAAAEIRKTLDASYEYMKQAGVKLGDLGYGKDYFPVVWDSSKITGNLDGFKAMLQKYKDAGAPIGDVNQVVAKLIGNGGSELGVERVMPGMQHIKTRTLAFIKPEDRAPFLNKNLYSTMNSYLQQASRRAEWARRFGDDNGIANKLLAQAEKDGASTDQIATAKKYLNGVNGTLGDDINPQFRRLFSNTLVYENIRLLSLGIFSSAPDAAGIFVRGGTVSDAFSTFKRGMVEIGRGFRDPENRKPDAAYQLSEDLGVIDSAMLQHVVGSVYSQDLGGFARKLNEGFFRYNLMDQYNRSMRVGATVAAGKFLARHGDGTESAHSTRWLAELGLKPGDVKMKDGDPLLTHAQFLDAGYSPAEAATRSTQMAAAVNKWVDGAILRPNAAQKPIYFNDPHFALISHLKQFVYSFQENILKRVVNEAKHGNYTPALGLASYIPIMIAADAAKGLIQGGGSQPNWKQGWDAGDYLWSGFQRAGLLGVGQFAADALEHKSGLLGVLGPTAEHFGEALSTVGGRERFGDFAIKSMPANALASPLLAHAGPDPSPNFAD